MLSTPTHYGLERVQVKNSLLENIDTHPLPLYPFTLKHPHILFFF